MYCSRAPNASRKRGNFNKKNQAPNMVFISAFAEAIILMADGVGEFRQNSVESLEMHLYSNLFCRNSGFLEGAGHCRNSRESRLLSQLLLGICSQREPLSVLGRCLSPSFERRQNAIRVAAPHLRETGARSRRYSSNTWTTPTAPKDSSPAKRGVKCLLRSSPRRNASGAGILKTLAHTTSRKGERAIRYPGRRGLLRVA